ncbi:MAG: DUF3857 domain-containing transglutaminase family protein [Cyclobacteriaceae bacterium]
MISGKPIILFLLGIIISLPLMGADFSAYDIPEKLRENASAVVRLNDKNVTIRRNQDATVDIRMAVTILKDKGRHFGYSYIFYDQFVDVRGLKATIYDAHGEKVETYKSKDFIDRSAISGYSIYEDNRVMYLRPQHHSFPYTIEYEYTMDYHQSLFYPVWQPQPAEEVSVQQASLTINAPGKEFFRYKELNLPDGSSARVSTDKGDVVYRWDVRNLQAWMEEELSPPADEYMPLVITAANDFEMDGYEGNMSSWRNFGKWILQLNEGRDELPPETVQEVKKVIAGAADDREKVRRLYKFMQGRTRYVSIQVGIGGFQPFKAIDVDENSYGDCKALSNYMYALLREAGIPSYYTLVNAGKGANRMMSTFPRSYFNHAILCVPVASDTLWLECTDQTNPMGYTGTFTSDREVLVINETGGHVVRTNVYKGEDNVLSRRATVTIAPDGNATADVTSEYKGIFYSSRASVYHTGSKEEQSKALYKRVHIPNFSIRDFTLEESGDECPVIEEKIALELPRYASKSGTRLFVPLKLMDGNKWSVDDMSQERRTDIEIRYNYTYVDTIRYKLPENFHAEAIPYESESFETEFGRFSSSLTPDAEGILYTRRFEVKKGRYAPARIDEVRDFFKQVLKADRAKAVLVNKS